MKNSTTSLGDFTFAAKLSGAIVSGVIAVTAVIGGHAATTVAGTTWDSTSTVVAGTTWDTAGSAPS